MQGVDIPRFKEREIVMPQTVSQQIEERGNRLSELWNQADAAIKSLLCCEEVHVKIEPVQNPRNGIFLEFLSWRKDQGEFGIWLAYRKDAESRKTRIVHAPLIAKMAAVSYFAMLRAACEKSAAETAAFLPAAINVLEFALGLGPQEAK